MPVTGKRRTREAMAEREASTGGLPLSLAKEVVRQKSGGRFTMPKGFDQLPTPRLTKAKRRK